MSSENRPRPPSSSADLFDGMWSSIADTASDFTRSIVGLPMFYRHTDDVQSIFAEPGLLSPQIITFHLDCDVDGIIGPFRFQTRPVSVFDVFSQGWGQPRRFGTGMMFLFGTPVENARWLVSPGLEVTGNAMFRPWGNSDEWIRKNFDEFEGRVNSVADEINRRISSFDGFSALEDNESKTTWRGRSWDDLEKGFHERIRTPTGSYFTETTTATNITRNEDGSVYKETVTTERLADGSTKTTRIVDTIPASGDPQSRTARTVTTSPATDMPIRREESPADIGKPKEIEGPVSSAKEETNPSNSTWWFWSRK